MLNLITSQSLFAYVKQYVLRLQDGCIHIFREPLFCLLWHPYSYFLQRMLIRLSLLHILLWGCIAIFHYCCRNTTTKASSRRTSSSWFQGESLQCQGKHGNRQIDPQTKAERATSPSLPHQGTRFRQQGCTSWRFHTLHKQHTNWRSSVRTPEPVRAFLI